VAAESKQVKHPLRQAANLGKQTPISADFVGVSPEIVGGGVKSANFFRK
jgi:hypothetical protein